jgi:hypothetical protein
MSITYTERVCSLSYTTCKVHAPRYIVICGLSGCTIFLPNYLIKRHDFRGKKILNIKLVFCFALQYLPEIFLILKKVQRDATINVDTSSGKVFIILVVF